MKATSRRGALPKSIKLALLRRLALVAFLLVHSGVLLAIELSPATAVVERLHSVLSENLRDGEAQGFAARVARVGPIVSRSFDFQAIARFALGREFDALDDAAKTRFKGLLEKLSIASYATHFSGSASQTQAPLRFAFVSERPARGGRTLVRTELHQAQQSPISLDYVLHHRGGQRLIVNVLADGVSDLSLKRAQYAAVIRSEGVTALFGKITQQLHTINEEGRTGG